MVGFSCIIYTLPPLSKPVLAVLWFGQQRPLSLWGAGDVVGRADGRTLTLASPPALSRLPLPHSPPLTGARLLLQIATTAIRAQPAVCGHQLDLTLSVASCSRPAGRGKAGTVTGQATLMLLPLQFSCDGTTAELQYPLLHKDLLI